MNAGIANQLQRLRELVGQMGNGMKVAAVGLVIAAIAGIIFFATRGEPVSMEVAFTNLETADSAQVVDVLRDNGVPYEVSSDGSTIRVPSDRVADARLMAASEGLPEGGTVGFELFDSTSFGITNFQQRVNYQRALEGELARTINRLDAVQSSRVMIAMPEETLFVEDQQPTTASAVLRLENNAAVPPDELRGIAHLIAGSVEGLGTEDITIVSTDGTMLWDGAAIDPAPFAGMEDQFTAQRAFEDSMERSIQQIIERVVGPGEYSVTVNAMMDWDQRSVQNEIFSPEGTEPQVRSQQETLETTTNSTDGAGGVPGTDSNIPTDQEPVEGEDETNVDTFSDTVTNYEISSSVEQIVEAPGDVQQLSVAVILNQERVDPEVVLTIEDLVRSAVGLDEARGDQMTVAAVPFSAEELVETGDLPGPSLLDRIIPIAQIALMILIPLALLVMLWRMLSKTDEEAVLTPVILGDISPQQAAAGAGGGYVDFRMQEVAPVELDETVATPSARRQQILRLAENDPAQLSALVRSWLAEDQR
jgi:flagellar M-ring protein FliF